MDAIIAQQHDRAFECLVHIVESNKGRSGRYMKYDTIRANFIRHIALKKLEQKEILSALEMTMIAFPCDENLTEQQKKELDSWHLSWKPQKAKLKKVSSDGDAAMEDALASLADDNIPTDSHNSENACDSTTDDNIMGVLDSAEMSLATAVGNLAGILDSSLVGTNPGPLVAAGVASTGLPSHTTQSHVIVPSQPQPPQPTNMSKHQRYRANLVTKLVAMPPEEAEQIRKLRRASDARRSKLYRDRKKLKKDTDIQDAIASVLVYREPGSALVYREPGSAESPVLTAQQQQQQQLAHQHCLQPIQPPPIVSLSNEPFELNHNSSAASVGVHTGDMSILDPTNFSHSMSNSAPNMSNNSLESRSMANNSLEPSDCSNNGMSSMGLSSVCSVTSSNSMGLDSHHNTHIPGYLGHRTSM